MASYNKKQSELTAATEITSVDGFSGGNLSSSKRYSWELVKEFIGLQDGKTDGGLAVFDADAKTLDISDVLYIDSSGDLHINTNIFQSGDTYDTHAENLYTTKDVIITRDGAVTGLATDEVTGIKASLYDGVNDGYLVFDNEGTAKVGKLSDLVALCGRDEVENLVDGHLLKWDSDTKTLVDSNVDIAELVEDVETNTLTLVDHDQRITDNSNAIDAIDLNSYVQKTDEDTVTSIKERSWDTKGLIFATATSGTNIDRIKHNDSVNAFEFYSDTSVTSTTPNSTLHAGNLKTETVKSANVVGTDSNGKLINNDDVLDGYTELNTAYVNNASGGTYSQWWEIFDSGTNFATGGANITMTLVNAGSQTQYNVNFNIFQGNGYSGISISKNWENTSSNRLGYTWDDTNKQLKIFVYSVSSAMDLSATVNNIDRSNVTLSMFYSTAVIASSTPTNVSYNGAIPKSATMLSTNEYGILSDTTAAFDAKLDSADALVLGSTSTTAYRGDRGTLAYNHSQITTGNPHNLDASDIGAVDNNNTNGYFVNETYLLLGILNDSNDSVQFEAWGHRTGDATRNDHIVGTIGLNGSTLYPAITRMGSSSLAIDCIVSQNGSDYYVYIKVLSGSRVQLFNMIYARGMSGWLSTSTSVSGTEIYSNWGDHSDVNFKTGGITTNIVSAPSLYTDSNGLIKAGTAKASQSDFDTLSSSVDAIESDYVQKTDEDTVTSIKERSWDTKGLIFATATSGTNIDRIKHNDSANAFEFYSDKAVTSTTPNSTLHAGNLKAEYVKSADVVGTDSTGKLFDNADPSVTSITADVAFLKRIYGVRWQAPDSISSGSYWYKIYEVSISTYGKHAGSIYFDKLAGTTTDDRCTGMIKISAQRQNSNINMIAYKSIESNLNICYVINSAGSTVSIYLQRTDAYAQTAIYLTAIGGNVNLANVTYENGLSSKPSGAVDILSKGLDADFGNLTTATNIGSTNLIPISTSGGDVNYAISYGDFINNAIMQSAIGKLTGRYIKQITIAGNGFTILDLSEVINDGTIMDNNAFRIRVKRSLGFMDYGVRWNGTDNEMVVGSTETSDFAAFNQLNSMQTYNGFAYYINVPDTIMELVWYTGTRLFLKNSSSNSYDFNVVMERVN